MTHLSLHERQGTCGFHLNMSAFTEGFLLQLHTASIDSSFLSLFPAEQTPAHSSSCIQKEALCSDGLSRRTVRK